MQWIFLGRNGYTHYMIVFQNVSVRYPLGNIGLHSVSLVIEDREFVYLVGPSGAGKTTILRLLLGEIKPTEGTLAIDGLDVTKARAKDIIALRQKIGIVFQDFKILHDKNVYENIALSMRIKGYNNTEIHHQISEALNLVHLSGKERMFPSQLSAGELQRVAIARAIIGDRSIILADEPTGNLDPKTTWEVMKIFKELEKSKTIIFATHNTDIVNSMKRRVIALKHAEVVKDVKKGGYEL